MGTTEILKTLRKGDRLTAIEISEKSKCPISSTNHSLKRLLKDVSESLKFRRLTGEEKETKYGHQVSCNVNLYWLDE